VHCLPNHYVGVVVPSFAALKLKHFGRLDINMHRADIMRRCGPFKVLKDIERETEFNVDMLGLYGDLSYTAIAVVVDKAAHGGRSRFYDDAYHFALALMLERFVGLLQLRGHMETLSSKPVVPRTEGHPGRLVSLAKTGAPH